MKQIAIAFSGEALRQLDCLALKRNETIKELIVSALSTLSTLEDLSENGIIKIVKKHEYLLLNIR